MYLLSASISCRYDYSTTFFYKKHKNAEMMVYYYDISWRKENWHYHRGNFANNDANLGLTAYWCQDISRYSLSNPKSFRSFDTNTMYRSNKFDTKKCCNIFCVISRTEINKGFLRRLQIYKEIVNATVTEIAPAAIIASSKTRFVVRLA